MKTENKSVVRSIRFTPRIIELADKMARHLGMKLPAYLSQLIVKDNSKKS